MECMFAETRPQFILSSERILGNGVKTHREKSLYRQNSPQTRIEPGEARFKPGSAGLQTQVCRSSNPGLQVFKPRSAGLQTWVCRSSNPGLQVFKPRSAGLQTWVCRSSNQVCRSSNPGLQVFKPGSAGLQPRSAGLQTRVRRSRGTRPPRQGPLQTRAHALNRVTRSTPFPPRNSFVVFCFTNVLASYEVYLKDGPAQIDCACCNTKIQGEVQTSCLVLTQFVGCLNVPATC